MREKNPEQLSIFDVLTDLEKPRDFFMPDSFNTSKSGISKDSLAFEKVKYKGSEALPDRLFTIYLRKCERPGTNCEECRYIVSIPSIDFTFGYNSLTRLLEEWDLKREEIN